MIQSSKRRILEYIFGYSFIVPAVGFIILFIAYPLIQSIILSFFEWNGMSEWEFTGINNYIKMLTSNRYFFTSLKNSIIFAIGTTSGTIIVGFVLAVLIDFRIKFWKVYRIVFFLPFVLSIVVVSILWLKVVDPYGILNSILGFFNLESLQRVWLSDPKIAITIVILVSIWQYSSFPMLFFLAGMQNIDEELYEAAKIDGASTARRIFSITMPLLKNVFSILIIMQLIFAFKVFDIIYIMTGGGPSGQTEVLGTLLYRSAFKLRDFGSASVIAVVMLIVAIVFSLIYIKVSGYSKTIRGN